MEEQKTPSGVIAIFVPGLEDTPGWLALSRKKQDALLEHTSHIQQNRQLQMLGEFGQLLELYEVQRLLEGESMKMTDYLRRIYPDRHIRTIQRKQESFREFVGGIHPTMLKKMREVSSETMAKFNRLASSKLGDIRNAIIEVPTLSLPVSSSAEVVERLEELDSKLLEHRKLKRRGEGLQMDETQAAKMGANALVSYIKSCGLATSAQKRSWLTRVVGWAMEAQAVAGHITATRLSIPGGVLVPLGRPPKKKPKEAA